ncbi:alpha- and gamma-adaptin-binding protein p34 [Ornithorhynchus anatinus]|uniref:Alpha and gamma adaptin binding protein n=1 Tax=Ornithorhynchus anatinus TaxID=9258 RepID=A0A6I8NC26_ORNAN|nr:alpha- and gamma-adaptin-binding protein p34 [Ornithorhynchus anatinus]
MAAGRPSALLASCAASFAAHRLVQHILGTEDLDADVLSNEGVTFYPWTLDNKYYSADINLCVVPNQFLVTSEIAESVQAFIVYFDSTLKSGLDGVSPWLPLAEEWLPEVMILVCDRVSEDGVSRQQAQEWCIKHGFELVELNPEELPDEDDDFPESTGVKRIIQALNANVWSNVVMKSDRTQGFGLLSSLTGANRGPGPAEDQLTESRSPAADRSESLLDGRSDGAGPADSQIDSIVDPMLDMDIQELANLTTGGGDLENFERLFSKLKEMKDKAATLPHEQRKLHAEKVAKAFWMAIGGDRDEIESLSSDEEN